MTTTANYLWPKPAGTDQPDGPSQVGVLADAIDTTLLAQLNAKIGNAGNVNWVDWSSSLSWIGSTGNPTKGNSVYVARYTYLTPHTVAFAANITVGSTFVAGTGFQKFNLPVTPADAAGYGATGTMWGNDSGVKFVAAMWEIEGSQINLFRYSSGATTPWTVVNLTFADWSPNVNDSLKISGLYEV